MVDLTSGAYSFQQAVNAGDYFEALGVAPTARKLHIDVAAAQWAERAPWMAKQVGQVANTLTHTQRRKVYEAIRNLRDQVLAALPARYGEAILEFIPDCRREVWRRCCEMMKFELEFSDLEVGPVGAESLARHAAEWIIEQLISTHLPVMETTSQEDHQTHAIREIWIAGCCRCGRLQSIPCRRTAGTSPDSQAGEAPVPAEEFSPDHYEFTVSPCPQCRTAEVEPIEFDDTYDFTLSDEPQPGQVLGGRGRRTGHTFFALRDGKPASTSPTGVLNRFYQAQHAGQDVSFDELWGYSQGKAPSAGSAPELQELFDSIERDSQSQQPLTTSQMNGPGRAIAVVGILVIVALLFASAMDQRSSVSPPAWQQPGLDNPLLKNPQALDPKSGRSLWPGPLDTPALSEAIKHKEAGGKHRAAGRLDEAAREYEQSLVLLQQVADNTELSSKPILATGSSALILVDGATVQRMLAESRFCLGLIYSNSDQLDRAKTSYQAAVAIRRSLIEGPARDEQDKRGLGSALGNLAGVLHRQGNFAEAATHYNEAVLLFQRHLQDGCNAPEKTKNLLKNTLWGCGHNAFILNRCREAITDFTQALALDATAEEIYRDRGQAYAAMAEWDRAAADFAEFTRRKPDDSRGWYCRALAERAPHRRDAYRQTCRTLLERFARTEKPPEANVAAWACALAADTVVDWATPLGLARRAVEAEPKDSAFRGTLGAILYRAGDYDAAIAELRQAIALHPQDGSSPAWLFLAMAYCRSGRTEEAGLALREEDALHKTSPEAMPAHWNWHIERELLRQEAEELFCAGTTP